MVRLAVVTSVVHGALLEKAAARYVAMRGQTSATINEASPLMLEREEERADFLTGTFSSSR